MKNSIKKESNKTLNKGWKQNLITIIATIVIIIVVVIIADSAIPNKESETPSLQIELNYKGTYDETDKKTKTIKFNANQNIEIYDCVFSDLKLVSSSTNSAFSGKFISHNDKLTGTVHIDFILYDKDKKIVKSFDNDLKDVEKDKEKIVLAEYLEPIDSIDSLTIHIQK